MWPLTHPPRGYRKQYCHAHCLIGTYLQPLPQPPGQIIWPYTRLRRRYYRNRKWPAFQLC